MGASSNNLTEIVHEMLKRGADPNVKNEVLFDTDEYSLACSPSPWTIIVQAGETALQIARSQENLDIVELLESCTEVSKNGKR